MDRIQKQGFTADRTSLNMEDYLELEYSFETIGKPEETAARLCQEMSTAQWSRVGVDEDFRPKFGAKVIDLTEVIEIDQPSSPHMAKLIGWDGRPLYACRVKIAYPYRNFGTKIPNMLTAICGEGVFHAPDICAIRLTDIRFPDSFLKDFQGPQFGVEGIREMLEVYDRPIFIGIIKPNIGLPPAEFGEIAYQAWLGGVDVAKDDEQIGNVGWSTLEERTKILGNLRKKAEDASGKQKMYLANITDRVDQLLDNLKTAERNGANAVLVNSMPVGFSALRMLREHASVPIISHFPLYTALSQLPFHGIRECVFTKIIRLCGADGLVYPGFDPRMKTPEEEVLASVRVCKTILGNLKPILPIPAGSESALTLPDRYMRIGSIDFGLGAGRGVTSHPLGPKGGAASLLQSWQAIQSGSSLEEYAKDHEELRLAIESKRS